MGIVGSKDEAGKVILGSLPPGFLDKKGLELRDTLDACLEKNMWFFSIGGLLLTIPICIKFRTERPFFVAAVTCPFADMYFGTLRCTPENEARRRTQKTSMLSSVHAAHLESVLHPQDVHVLLVDDEQLSRLVVGNLLRKCDYKVTVAESGAQALEVLQRSLPGTFQLILTDVMMPDVDGLDILRYVRSNAQLADLPVIMMSANERKDAVFEAIRGGAEEYLVKPVTKKEVQNIWQHVWKRLSAAKLLRDQHEADLHTDDAPAAATTTGTQPTSNNNTSLGSSQQQQQLVQQQQQQLQVQQRQLLQSMQQLHRTPQVVQQPDPLAPDVLGGGSAMVSTAAFDRDDEYLATAGVSKRIRIFEYAAITSSACGGGFGCAAGRAAAPGMGGYSGGGGGFGGGSAAVFGGPMSPGRGAAAAGGGGGADGIVYPVLELSTRSRLSCVAWSSYVKAHLASSDHDGVVTLWDANTGGELVQFEEHSRRAWAVDFSRLEPTRLVSCSDDSTVKLWSVHEEASLATLQLHANVCSVQFSPESPHLLACGCANFRTYLFDLRNTAQPLACVHGHRRAVSYVRWLGGEQLVTASTDNSLKLWSVPTMASAGISHCAGGREASASAASTACITAYGGHLNQRNFIGLAVLPGSPGNSSSGGLGRSSGSSSRPASGYIVCGSETNEVYAYHTSMPVPVAAHSFGGAGGAAAAAAGGAGGRGRRGGGGSAAELDLLHGEHGEGCGGAGGLQQQGEGPFVSCVAWNRRQGTIVAGNSAGHIKVLELV
ncbi:hypothetical protein OEZ85_012415 [Tetradesmus obliquus]|uniref:Response regulatory domain-containing protein n=1 Tax=Tetradesmus obliquus TaxID=3088 RepID=A0ABY8TVR8_TETOB|nr:hypothetical protein OEZ85_012415 [Tetradesmus obliquus]